MLLSYDLVLITNRLREARELPVVCGEGIKRSSISYVCLVSTAFAWEETSQHLIQLSLPQVYEQMSRIKAKVSQFWCQPGAVPLPMALRGEQSCPWLLLWLVAP